MDAQASRRLPGRAAALGAAAALALAAVAWVVAVRQMTGMDMGVATRPGSFSFFAVVWTCMMAAMMLPGAALAVGGQAEAGGVRSAASFIVVYLAVWALIGVAAFELDRPHGTVVAGSVTIMAGLYELTAVKRSARRRCRDAAGSGLGFGLYCVTSSIGLMAMLVALGVMSLTWMAVVTVIVAAQKLLPAYRAVDLPLALAIIGLGGWIILAPGSVPGLTPMM
jgi:predicted metal-binding membrane protein